MKKTIKVRKLIKKFDQLFSCFSEGEILNPDSLISIRGGDGSNDGGGVVIIIPPPPPPPPTGN